MDWYTIHERVSSLQQEVAWIRERNREYLVERRPSQKEKILYGRREDRLVQILQELAALTRTFNVGEGRI